MDILRSLTNCRVFSTVSQEEDEAGWLAARGKGIGGSDVGAICGVNKWTTARHIYLKKTGQFQEGIEEFNEAAKERMHFGHMLEPIVADEYARRTGKKVAVSPATLQHKDYPWALANVDRFIVDDEGKPYGILECKTADARLAETWEEGDVPIYYLYQLNWYLWITGLEYGAIACLVGGNKYYFYELYRNDDLLKDVIVPAADRFWNYNVAKLIMPEVEASEAASDLLDIENPPEHVDPKSEIRLEEDTCNELATTIKKCKAEIKELEKIMLEATNKLKDKIGTNATAYTRDHVVKWSPRKQVRVDTSLLKEAYPDIYEQCKKEIPFRAFSVK